VDRFKLPNDFILKDVATVPGIDGEKMSKSKGNVVALFGTEEEVKKSIMSIVTDSAKPEDKKNPDENNIYKIHKLFLNEEEDKILRGKFENANAENLYGYAEAKKDLVNTVMEWREGKYEKYLELMSDEQKIRNILKIGAEKAKIKAVEMMKKVRVDTGLDF
jgi:tryptophanyl-tRNA synthetase